MTRGATRIGVIPVGFNDGFLRGTKNPEVLVRGARVPVVGSVCMDQMMVEVPERLGVTVGDEVVLVGEQGAERIVMDELAGLAGTINYELACSFALRMDRVASLFGGGGHACAAGLNTKEPLSEVQPRLLAALAETLARVDALKSQ